jgi:hypothetical protein
MTLQWNFVAKSRATNPKKIIWQNIVEEKSKKCRFGSGKWFWLS